ncbi:MAG: glycoside hydrolase, partial [Bacteroidales bacterium]|nr:glycoside hydrolase [Bacteroidales bacterium]
MRKLLILSVVGLMAFFSLPSRAQSAPVMKLNDLGYFEARGTNVLVYNNLYNGAFYDEKFAGLEIIQRGERIATGGGIRLMNTPEQWDIFGEVSNRIVSHEGNFVEVTLTHTDYDFAARYRVFPKDGGCVIQVILDKPVPEALVGKAGLNLEFFPASYFGKNYLVDGLARILPKYP